MAEKLKMRTENIADKNFEALSKLFPNAVTEAMDENGEVVRAIDADVLRQEISCKVVEGREERYQFMWPDKKKAMLMSNVAISATLRPNRNKSSQFDTTENLYIEGDNLDVLRLMHETYLGKVKTIYIDPPYNKGKDFVYRDNYKNSIEEYMSNSGQYDEMGNRLVANSENSGRFHTDWLNMIYPRLKVARDLLRDDGIIFISIDDNELDNTRKVCDEIFGQDNFIAHIIYKNNSMKNQSKYVGVSTEYILTYCKDKTILSQVQPAWRANKKGASDIKNMFQKLKAQGLSLDEIREEIMEMYSRPKYAHLSRWNKVDEKGVFTDKDLSRNNGPKNYTIINPTTGGKCPIPTRGWGKSYEELLQMQKENMIWYGDASTPPREKSYITEDTESVFDNFIFSDSSIDKKYIDKIFGSPVFEFPKSKEMLKQLLGLCTEDGDIILDFFSGSASAAHAVMELNSEDGKKRKYIMVQVPEKTDEDSVAFKAGYETICEIGEQRIRLSAKEYEDKGIDTGFRVLNLDSSNMKEVYYCPADTDQTLLDVAVDNIKSDRTPEDLLFQVMLDLGVLLSSKIEEMEIDGKKVFNVADGFLVACFDKDVTDETIRAVAKMKPYYAVFRDNSMASDSVATNFDQIFASISPDTIRKVL